jgi:hypothetical protein
MSSGVEGMTAAEAPEESGLALRVVVRVDSAVGG